MFSRYKVSKRYAMLMLCHEVKRPLCALTNFPAPLLSPEFFCLLVQELTQIIGNLPNQNSTAILRTRQEITSRFSVRSLS